MTIRVQEVQSDSARMAFTQLASAVYCKDPFHIPSSEEVPGDGTSFIAYSDGTPQARCTARLQTGSSDTGTIGTFEAFNDPAAAKAVLSAAAIWLKEQGAERIIGPMNGDTWHAYRFNTGPFDDPPFIKEPWNPPYYPALWEAAGFRVIETYDSYIIDEPNQAAANQEKYHVRCMNQGHTFIPVNANNFEDKLPLLHELSCRIFAGNVLYTPVGLEEFKRMYIPAKPLFRPGLSWLALAPDGTPEAYIFTFPDYADAMRSMNGRSNLPAKLRFLMNRGKARRTCIKTLGTVPEKRRTGITAALTYLAYKNSAVLGYRQTLMCLMHSDNDSRRFGGNADRPFRSYALYEYEP